MKLGLIARADNTGLGIQTHELYKHLTPHKTFIIDLTEINAANGKRTAMFLDRYPHYDAVFNGIPTAADCETILEDIDVLLSVEIPYNYQLFAMAKDRGVKTVLQYNYEFLDYLNRSDLPYPDLLLAPSLWQIDAVKNHLQQQQADCQVKFLPVPVNRQLIPFQHRSFAEHFVHVAGHKTYADRNGTDIVLAAIRHIESDITLTIHSQSSDVLLAAAHTFIPPNVKLVIHDTEVKNYQDIYNNPDYDVVLLPRRYGGLSLQLDEALSAGLPVIMPDISPNNTILPPAALIAAECDRQINTRTTIDVYDADPRELAAKIDELHSHPNLVSQLSREADDHASHIAWQVMRPVYLKTLEQLCQPK